jgi:protein involved in polysaccharide export with SLBB domain
LKQALEFAGGLKPTAYIERIQIDRIVPFAERKRLTDERKMLDVELASYLTNPKADVDLSDGDTVSIFSILDLRKNVVTVQGAVVRPSVYELCPGETVRRLIERAGGVLGEVYLDRADLLRTRKDLKTELRPFSLAKALEGDPEHNLPLQRRDQEEDVVRPRRGSLSA